MGSQLPELEFSLMGKELDSSSINVLMDDMTTFRRKWEEITKKDPNKRKNPINMSGGDPGIDPRALQLIKNNTKKFENSPEFEQSLHYGPVLGQYDVLEILAEYYSRLLNTDLTEKNVMVVNSSELFFFYFINGFKGDNLAFIPDYCGYKGVKFLNNFVSVSKIPVEDGNHEFHYEIPTKAAKNTLKNNRQIIKFPRSVPTNPTGELQSRNIEKEIFDATQNRVHCVIDFLYRQMIYDNDKAKAFEENLPYLFTDNITLIDGASKKALAGWRFAPVISSEKNIKKLGRIQAPTMLCPTNPEQFVIARMYDNGDIDRVAKYQREFNQKRMELAARTLKQELNVPNAMIHEPLATFYLWYRIKDLTKKGTDMSKFLNALKYEEGIPTCDGSGFFYGRSVNGNGRQPYETARFSVSNLSLSDIKEAMPIIADRTNRLFHRTA